MQSQPVLLPLSLSFSISIYSSRVKSGNSSFSVLNQNLNFLSFLYFFSSFFFFLLKAKEWKAQTSSPFLLLRRVSVRTIAVSTAAAAVAATSAPLTLTADINLSTKRERGKVGRILCLIFICKQI